MRQKRDVSDQIATARIVQLNITLSRTSGQFQSDEIATRIERVMPKNKNEFFIQYQLASYVVSLRIRTHFIGH